MNHHIQMALNIFWTLDRISSCSKRKHASYEERNEFNTQESLTNIRINNDLYNYRTPTILKIIKYLLLLYHRTEVFQVNHHIQMALNIFWTLDRKSSCSKRKHASYERKK